MKKRIFLALTLLMLFTASLAYAKTVRPEQLYGATVHASVGEYNVEEKTFTVTVYDYDVFHAEEVAELEVGDTILAGGWLYRITEIQDSDGTRIFACDGGEEIFFEKAPEEDGLIAVSTYDDRVFMNVVTVLHLPAAEDIVYEDHSDPEANEMKTIKGLGAILKAKGEKEENSIGFHYYATTVTLNDNLEIVKIHQDFDVAQ